MMDKILWITGFLIIVVTFALYQISHKPELVMVFTDKAIYQQGEVVDTSVKYDGEIYVWGGSHWSVQKLENYLWSTIFVNYGCNPYLDCKMFDLNENENYPSCVFIGCEPPSWYKINSSHFYWDFTWKQFYQTGTKTFKCYDDGFRDIKGDEWIGENICTISEQVPPGRYKIILEYALDINNSWKRESAKIKYAEQEFWITDKENSSINTEDNGKNIVIDDDLRIELKKLKKINENHQNINPKKYPLLFGKYSKNGLALVERYFCSDVCPNSGYVAIYYDGITDSMMGKLKCKLIGGKNVYDPAWKSYIGCVPKIVYDEVFRRFT